MSEIISVKVPDLGGASDVEVIEILVAVGDSVELDESLITVESDKASMDVPSSASGTITKIEVAVGDAINEGDTILSLEVSAADKPADAAPAAQQAKEDKPATVAPQAQAAPGSSDAHADLVVIGSGPGGYTAAFRAADLGLNVTLIERHFIWQAEHRCRKTSRFQRISDIKTHWRPCWYGKSS